MKAAVYCGTRNLYADMVTAAKSLAIHSDVDRIYFLIEDDEFPFELPPYVRLINVSDQPFFDKSGPNYKNGWTYMVLMRAALHKIFPSIDRIVSLDVDTIVVQDVSNFWDFDISNYYFAGCKEPYKSKFGLYINAGVMLLNLEKLRDGKGDEIVDALNTKFFPFNEQDCINQLCSGTILEIPSDYNANNWTVPTTTPKIIHFAAIPKWQNAPLVKEYAKMDWPCKI